MKKSTILLLILMSNYFLPNIIKASETVNVTFKFIAANTISGYDHVSKLIVYCDDKKIGESSEKIQSKSNTVTVKIPTGYHAVKATLYALYNGEWEKRTKSNEYSFDFEYNKTASWNEDKIINLTFDINKEKTIVSETGSGNKEIVASSQTENYKDALKKINTYLKTFDNGYYGYLEVIDGYLYDRFSSGKYSKVKISDVDKVTVEEANRKVVMNCKYDKECVYSTYTDSYHTKNSFSQTSDFNTKELVDLLNDFITAYNGKSNTISSANNSSTTSKVNNNKTALQKLNDYLKTFDNGYYGYFEVKDGYIYNRFKAGKYNKFKMEDIEGAIIQEEYKRVIFKCKGSAKCISTDWKVNGTEDYTQFTNGSPYNYQELADLLNDFKDEYSGNKTTTINNLKGTAQNAADIRAQKEKERKQQNSQTNNNEDEDWDALESTAVVLNKSVKEAQKNSSSTPTNKNYELPLQKLNNYLKIFNSETYDKVEVKDSKVYFYFKVYTKVYNSSISISDLVQNTTIINGKSVGTFGSEEIKIFCKNDGKYFYSTYSNGNADHFRFFSNTVKDLSTIELLVKDFVKALK